MVRLLFYRDVTLNRFSLFAEHFFRICQAPSIFFELTPFFFGITGSLLFECSSLVRVKRGPPSGFDYCDSA